MEIFNEYSIEHLDQYTVSIAKRRYVIIESEKLYLDGDLTEVYINSVLERVTVQENIPAPYITAIMAIWGDQPTTEDETIIEA